jgi:hypothetical protein
VSQIENSSSDHRFARLRSALRTRAGLHLPETTPPHIEQRPTDNAAPAAGPIEPATTVDIDQSPSPDLRRTRSAPEQSPREFEKVAAQLKFLGLAVLFVVLSPVIAIGLYFLVVGN